VQQSWDMEKQVNRMAENVARDKGTLRKEKISNG